MSILPFSILAYQNNPAVYQIGQIVSILPISGFSASSYTITAGSLPSGFLFNTSTGAFTGSPVALTTSPVSITVQATLSGGGTTTCLVLISVVNIPATANASNTASANDLTNLREWALSNFLTSAEQIITNNNQLGIFHAYFDLSPSLPYQTLALYLTSLNFSVELLYPSQNNSTFQSFFGQPENFPGPDSFLFPDFNQPSSTLVRSKITQRIRVSWSQFTGFLPFYPYSYFIPNTPSSIP